MVKLTNADPVMAEALTALYATIFGKQMGYRKIIFEGDAQVIVKEMNKESPCTSKYEYFVEGIKTERRVLESTMFTYVRREANTVAHTLAKMANTRATDNTWLEFVPPDIYGIVRREESFPSL